MATHATLTVPAALYDLVVGEFKEAGFLDRIFADGTLDMHGIALVKETPKPEDWRERLKAEKAELDEKGKKLTAFLQSPNFGQLQQQDQTLLVYQRDSMLQYSNILAARIERFS